MSSGIADLKKYPHVLRFSTKRKIAPENLVLAFELEREFHETILNETNAEKRKLLYSQIYNSVHPLYKKKPATLEEAVLSKEPVVKLFRQELEGKKILDVGCGQGAFLTCVARNIRNKGLIGIDISTPVLPENIGDINFINGDIIDFKIAQKVDLVFSDNVTEHIAPMDLPTHLKSVRHVLKDNGIYIMIMPNRLFGPSDVTRIIDESGTNKIPAQGTHLNESTYHEMIRSLNANGFGNFKTILPIPGIVNIWRNFRFDPAIMSRIEKSPGIMKLLYFLKRRTKFYTGFAVVLISQKIN